MLYMLNNGVNVCPCSFSLKVISQQINEKKKIICPSCLTLTGNCKPNFFSTKQNKFRISINQECFVSLVKRIIFELSQDLLGIK